MIVIYNFAGPPSDSMIAAFRADIASSAMPALGTYYVTGSAVLTEDITDVFGPVVGITVVPGVLAALAIVGVLLLAPLAALVPVIVGGIAIAIALPTHLLRGRSPGPRHAHVPDPRADDPPHLGPRRRLLRPPAEEDQGGEDQREDHRGERLHLGQVGGSGGAHRGHHRRRGVHRHGGGQRPALQRRGHSIAIAVSILILAALTLLPALELTLKDRLFWPGLNRRRSVQHKSSRLRSLGETP